MDNKNENKKIVLDIPTAKRVEAYAREFTRIHDVDKERLSNLVLRAKGENRSMRQFAEQIGTTPSTVSNLSIFEHFCHPIFDHRSIKKAAEAAVFNI